MALTAASVPNLWRLARLGFDDVRKQHVLLYPEGAVMLNPSGHAILELCDGQRTIQQIADELGTRFNCDVLADVTEYLSKLEERELVHGS